MTNEPNVAALERVKAILNTARPPMPLVLTERQARDFRAAGIDIDGIVINMGRLGK